MALTWTQQEIDTLKEAVASGVLTVVFDGPPRRQVTYQSLAEMRSLLSSMVATAEAAAGGSSYRLGATRKGL